MLRAKTPEDLRRSNVGGRRVLTKDRVETKLSALSAEFNTMKEVNKLALLLSLSAILPFAAAAKSPESTYIEHCLKSPEVPVPVAVVTPSVLPEYAGSTVEVEFTVDTSGKPIDLSVKSSPDTALSTAVVDAVKQWRFTPAQANGIPVAKKVFLPVKIVDDLPGTRYAAN